MRRQITLLGGLVVTMLGFVLCGGSSVLAAGGKKRALEEQAAADALFTNGTLRLLRIEVPRRSVESMRRNDRQYVPVTLREYALPNLREPSQVYTNVRVHLKGSVGSFRPFDDKPGLTLNLGDTNGTFHGLKKFHLNNSVQDPTYLSDWFSSDLFHAAGVPAPRNLQVLVELNGRKLGLYVLREAINRDFLGRYFQDTRGNVYGQQHPADINMAIERMGGKEAITNRADLKRLTAASASQDPKVLKEKLPQALDVERFLSFMAVETMLCDWDGYTMASHNFRVYHNLDEDKMVFLPHDKDQILGDSRARIVPRANGRIAQAVLRVPEWRQRYRERFGEIFTNHFKPTVLARRIDERVAALKTPLQVYDADLAAEWVATSHSLKERIVQRHRSLVSQFRALDTLRFTNDVAVVKGWRPTSAPGGATLERVKDDTGKPLLRIKTGTRSNASWNALVRLEPGRYALQGRARSAGVQPLEDAAQGVGGGLRISGTFPPRANHLEGDSPWTELAYEFQVVAGSAQVELRCELCATAGEVWFDEESLRLARVK